MKVYDQSFQTVNSEFTKSKDDLIEMEQKLETSIELLLETQNLFDKKILSPAQKSKQTLKNLPMKSDIHRYGLGSSSYNLQLSIDVNKLKLVETDDNRVLFEEIREGCKCKIYGIKLVIEKKYLPNLSKWTKKVAKVQMNDLHQEFLKELINAKSRLNQILTNVRNLGVVWNLPRVVIPKAVGILDSDDEEEDFLLVSRETLDQDNIETQSYRDHDGSVQNECLPSSSKDLPEPCISDEGEEQEITSFAGISKQKAGMFCI